MSDPYRRYSTKEIDSRASFPGYLPSDGYAGDRLPSNFLPISTLGSGAHNFTDLAAFGSRVATEIGAMPSASTALISNHLPVGAGTDRGIPSSHVPTLETLTVYMEMNVMCFTLMVYQLIAQEEKWDISSARLWDLKTSGFTTRSQGGTKEEHLRDLRRVMEILKEHQLRLNIQKCEFIVHEVNFLGYVVGTYGLKVDRNFGKLVSPLNLTESEDKARVLCFVEFTDAKCAKIALDALQGYKFDDKKTNAPILKIFFAHFPIRLPS